MMNTSVTTLLLVRHAEVEERYHRVYGGKIDMGLSARGQEQAQALAGFLRGQHRIDAVYASPMRRVRETMAPLNGDLGVEPVFMEGLREIDFGDWTGLNFQQIRDVYRVEPWEWLNELDGGRMPNAENLDRLRERIQLCLQHVAERHTGQKVAIFAHGGVIRVALSLLLELPLTKMASFEVAYASVTEVELIPGRGVELQTVNFIPWK